MTMRPGEIYFDNNSTTRMRPEVVETVTRHFRDSFANPGSRHAAGRRARRVLEDARELLAALLGAAPDEVIFTSGGSESNNLALHGLLGDAPGTIALTAGEHPSIAEPCRALARRGCRLHTLEVDTQGLLQPEQFAGLPWDALRLVTVILAHNETGVVQALEPLAALCRTFGVPLHVDGVQAAGKIPVDFHRLQATSFSFAAHKFHGPRGIGGLLLAKGTNLVPAARGGHQESGLRPGTEPVPLIAGMAHALELWHSEAESRTAHVRQLRDWLEQGLLARCAPAVVHGAKAPRLPNTLNIAFPGADGEALLVALDLEGIACSLGSTCASGAAEPSPALVAMGCPPDIVRGSIRFSLAADNTAAEIDEALKRITAIVQRLR